ncbi:MAG TPA: helix-turn-helix transcriptional regulator [Pseudonocardiaceae bacterium]|nr:helix-turn-helix transcriptional regulator [Pseudonocardiaceae bacterium]
MGKALNQEMLGRWLGLTQAQVSKVERGNAEQNLDVLREYAQILHLPQRLLWFDLPGQSRLLTLTSPGDVAAPASWEDTVVASARQSLEFLAWVQDDQVSPAVLEHVMLESRRIAIDYVHRPLMPLFGDLMALRDTTFGLLKDRPRQRQPRELFFVAGTVCTLAAHASQNLGSSSAARAHAAAAWVCAEQADHRDLRAWVRGTQALIEEWSDDYDRAVVLAREGQQHASSAESTARLAAIEARALARAGDVAGAVAAVRRAHQARDQATRPDALADFGGVLSFPYVKQLYYAGSTLALAGEYADAEQAALEAIRLYEAGPLAQRSYGDEALARVAVAIARSADGDLEGTHTALEPVLNLPSDQRIRQIASGLDRVRQHLALPRYAGSMAAQELTREIDGFAEDAKSANTVNLPR